MKTSYSGHYEEDYFSWQITIGEFGGWANLSKFQKYIRPEYNIIDFGCGGGYLLKNIKCRNKIGIEVNLSARRQAEQNGIKTCESALEVEDSWAHLIISTNALEHCLHPLQELKILYSKLRTDGLIVFVVPCESISCKYFPNDINHHLYSWSPMCLGNLFAEAGFVVKESKPYIHKWPPYYRQVARIGGRTFFEICCRIFGHIKRSWFQVRVVAYKT